MAWGDTSSVLPVTPVTVTALPEREWTPEEWQAERDKLLMEWDAAKKASAAAVETECAIRVKVGEFVFPTETRKEGVNKHELGHGYELKLGHKVSYNLTGSNDGIIAVEEACGKVGNEGTFIVERLIKWTAELSVGEYKKLRTEAGDGSEIAKKVLEIVEPIIETKNGMPSLEIKEPRANTRG